MCKAHNSKVTHIKQQKYCHYLEGRGFNEDCVLYPRLNLEVMNIFAVLYVSLCYGPYTLL